MRPTYFSSPYQMPRKPAMHQDTLEFLMFIWKQFQRTKATARQLPQPDVDSSESTYLLGRRSFKQWSYT